VQLASETLVPIEKPQLGSVKSFNENPHVPKVLMKQSLIEPQKHPIPAQHLLTVANKRQVVKDKRLVKPFDALNLTDPCINQSMLSENPRQNGTRPTDKVVNKQHSINIMFGEQHNPHLLEKRYLGPRMTNGPPAKMPNQPDIPPLVNQRPPLPVPLQPISNTPRYHHKQPDTLTMYRKF